MMPIKPSKLDGFLALRAQIEDLEHKAERLREKAGEYLDEHFTGVEGCEEGDVLRDGYLLDFSGWDGRVEGCEPSTFLGPGDWLLIHKESESGEYSDHGKPGGGYYKCHLWFRNIETGKEKTLGFTSSGAYYCFERVSRKRKVVTYAD